LRINAADTDENPRLKRVDPKTADPAVGYKFFENIAPLFRVIILLSFYRSGFPFF
jgi:hypothetical protein